MADADNGAAADWKIMMTMATSTPEERRDSAISPSRTKLAKWKQRSQEQSHGGRLAGSRGVWGWQGVV